MSISRVLVTGGAGHLGRQLAECFLADGHEVRIVDAAPAPSWSDVDGLEYLRADVRDTAAVEAATRGVQLVVHAAFASPRSPSDTVETVNVTGTRNVLAAADRIGNARVVLVSSTIVERPARRSRRSSPAGRLEVYRSSRIAAERVAHEFCGRGAAIAVVRPVSFVGPERVGAFAIVFEQIRAGAAVPVVGDGRNRYQLLDIRDLAEGVRLLQDRGVGLYRFGAARFDTMDADLETLIAHAGTRARLCHIPALPARAGMRALGVAGLAPLSEWYRVGAGDHDAAVDIGRARRELGWHPRHSNAEALIDAYDGYVRRISLGGDALSVHPVPRSHRVLQRVFTMTCR